MRFVLAMAALVPLSCTSSRPYSISSVRFCALKGKTFYVVVKRDTGTATTTLPSPCPKTAYSLKKRYLYKLTYVLGARPQPPRVFGPVEVPPEETRVEKSLEERIAGNLMSCRLLKTPRVASLTSFLHPKIVWIDEDPLPAQEAKPLRRLGFRTKRAKCQVDTAAGRWYLGFGSDSRAVQVCCPKKGFFRERRIDTDGDAIWDPNRARILLVTREVSLERRDESRPPIIGLPTSIVIWDYKKNKLTSFKLAPITAKDLPE
jgi:hypothetical protein